MANYGDEALKLPPDWARTRLANEQFGLLMVGHEDGVADAYLTDDPDAKHEFKFVDPTNRSEIDMARTNHYTFVTADKWTKNDKIWVWLADGRLDCMGNVLMARPKRFYDEQIRKREAELSGRTDRDDEKAREVAARAGIEVFDEGKPSKSKRR